MFHGEKDRVVNIDQATKMARALKRNGITYTYETLPDGSHFLDVKDNRLTFLSKTAAFLETCLN